MFILHVFHASLRLSHWLLKLMTSCLQIFFVSPLHSVIKLLWWSMLRFKSTIFYKKLYFYYSGQSCVMWINRYRFGCEQMSLINRKIHYSLLYFLTNFHCNFEYIYPGCPFQIDSLFSKIVCCFRELDNWHLQILETPNDMLLEFRYALLSNY